MSNKNRNNKNISKFCSLSSISSNKNYNKGYFTSMTAENGTGNNNNYNYSNISEKFTDGNSYINNNDDQSMYTPSEIEQKEKENDPEYEKLQNRKLIIYLIYFLLYRIR